MRKIIICWLSGFVVFFAVRAYQNAPPFDGAPIVPYGVAAAMSRADIREIPIFAELDPAEYAERGLPTIIEFCSAKCSNCRQLHQRYSTFLKLRPDVAVRQVRLPDDWQSDRYWKRHKIKISRTPHIIIYSPEGKLIARDTDRSSEGSDFLYEWMTFEIEKALNKGPGLGRVSAD